MSEQTTTQTDTPAKPPKKPFRWSKRFAITLGAMLILTVVFRIGWGIYASNRLETVMAEASQIDPRMEWKDFWPTEEVDNSPAAEMYERAWDIYTDLQLPCPSAQEYLRDKAERDKQRPDEQPDGQPDTDGREEFALDAVLGGGPGGFEMEDGESIGLMDEPWGGFDDGGLYGWPPPGTALDELLEDARGENKLADMRTEARAKLKDVLDLIDQADAHPAGGMSLRKESYWDVKAGVSNYRELAYMLRFAAIEANLRGDSAEAIKRIRQMGRQAEMAGSYPGLIGHLARIAVLDQQFSTIEEIAPTLDIGSGETQVSPEQLRKLIRPFSDTESLHDAFAAAAAIERSGCLEHLRGFLPHVRQEISGMQWWGFQAVSGPIWKLDQALLIDYMNGFILAARQDSLRTYWEIWEPYSDNIEAFFEDVVEGNLLKKAAHLLSSIMLPSISHSASLHYAGITRRRLAAFRLAFRLHQVEHPDQGELTMEQIAEQYDIPLFDPLTGGKLHMITQGRVRVITSSRYKALADLEEDKSRWWPPVAIWLDPSQHPRHTD